MIYDRILDICINAHEDVITWKCSQCYWPFVKGIYQLIGDSLCKGSAMRSFMFSLLLAWINYSTAKLKVHWDDVMLMWHHCEIMCQFEWYFLICKSHIQNHCNSQRKYQPFVLITVPADGLAPLGARPSACTMIIYYIYLWDWHLKSPARSEFIILISLLRYPGNGR